ncbi:MAG: LysM domain-containing protein [Rickettsiales endosymbiont of Dermacentor nuttalli]
MKIIKKLLDIMRKTTYDSLKTRVELRASFVEEGKMQFGNIHIVKPGNNLEAIAKAHGISFDEIVKLNPKLRNPNKLSIGEKINLKSKEETDKATKDNQNDKAEKLSISDIMINIRI